MAQKIVYWLLIALILSLGFGQLLRFDFYGIPIYLHDILVLLFLVSALVPNFVKNKVRNFVFPGYLKIFILALILSSLRALTLYPLSSLLVPSLYLLRLLTYLALYLLLQKSKLQVPKLVFLIAGIVALTIGLIQYFFMPDMRIFQYLGWDDHLSRLTLPHFDPTFTAVMLGLFALSLPVNQWFIGALVCLSILLTYSRSVWLSLAFTFAYFMMKNKKYKYLIIGICLLVIPISLLPKRFGEGTNLLRTYSISSRVESDLSYITKYKWDLVLGRGLNTLILDQDTTHASGPNNSYLYLLTTTGVLGLVGWGIFMWSIYQKSRYKPMLVFFFVASLFNNVMFYPFALLWIFLIDDLV
ncbi:MAG: hypothetical protein WAV40_00825 [Microgenomates group bacterium]